MIDDINISKKFNKAHNDIKAGKAVPRAWPEDLMELIKCMTMQTRDVMTGKGEWGKDHDGHTIAQIAKEEGKSFGEILDEVSQEKEDFEKEKANDNKSKEKKVKGKKVKHCAD